MAFAGGALRRIGAHALRLLSLRVALAAEELDAARGQWLRWLALAVSIVLLAMLALLAVGAAVAAAFWPQIGWPILLVIAAVYGGFAALLLGRLQAQVRAAPPLLAATRHEFERDWELVRGVAPAPSPPPPERSHE